MRLTPFLLLSLSVPAVAQVGSDDFEAGNPSDWGVEFNQPGAHMAAGGNPGGRVELAISNTTSMLPAAMIVPAHPAHPYQGDFRALAVTNFAFDRQVESGASNFGSLLFLVLGHDGGTPTDFADDSWAFIYTGDSFQFGMVPWATVSTPIPAAEMVLPSGWDIQALPGSPLVGLDDNALWNALIQDVSYVGISMGRPWNGGSWFGSHILSLDNMVLEGTGMVGTQYCTPGNANSTGMPSVISALGSDVIAVNALSLAASDLPASSFCYFLTSLSQGFVANPGGSMGNLCLGGAIGRYVGPGQIQQSNAAGEAFLALDLTTMPTPNGPVGAQPGETWNFQAWHRDAVGGSATSNLTDGISVTFQ